MTIIRDMAPQCFRYSIDEAFAILDGFSVRSGSGSAGKSGSYYDDVQTAFVGRVY
jgi:hypothetical protein